MFCRLTSPQTLFLRRDHQEQPVVTHTHHTTHTPHTHRHTHTHTHTHTERHTHKRHTTTHTHTHTQRDTHPPTHPPTHTHPQPHTERHTHTHTHPHTHSITSIKTSPALCVCIYMSCLKASSTDVFMQTRLIRTGPELMDTIKWMSKCTHTTKLPQAGMIYALVTLL